MFYVNLGGYNRSAHRRRRLLAAMPGPVDWLLDVGCGDGFLTTHLGAAARKVVGIDLFFEPLIAAARRDPTVSWVQIARSGRRYPFRDCSFAAVTAFEILEHCPDPAAVLCEIARVLKPGGWLVMTTPNYKNFQRRLGVRTLRGLPKYPTFPIRWAGLHEDGVHFWEFEPRELKQLLAHCGFHVKSLRGDFVGLALWRGRYTIQLGLDWLGTLFPEFSFDLHVVAERVRV